MPEDLNNRLNDEISLLDLLMVAVQNLRLIITLPFLTGIIALMVAYYIPPTYESVAVQSGDAKLVEIYKSAQVLDAINEAQNLTRTGEARDIARARVAESINIKLGKNGTIRITGSADSPEKAQALVKIAMEKAAIINEPRVAAMKKLVEWFNLNVAQEKEYFEAVQRVTKKIDSNKTSDVTDLEQYKLQLLEAARGAQMTSATLSAEIRQGETFEVLQRPTLPTQKTKPREGLITLMAVLVSGFVIFLIIFIRQTQLGYERNEETARKVAMLKISLKKALSRR